jgi:patatin-like phospholipase/acyl hydrolase
MWYNLATRAGKDTTGLPKAHKPQKMSVQPQLPEHESSLTYEPSKDNVCRILSLDGGGAKGFYTLGVLKEIEAMLGCPLHKRFDLIFGTSTGAIIAALLALGYEVDQIHDLYRQHVPAVVRKVTSKGKTQALAQLADSVFQDRRFDEMKTGVGIVATKWITEKPMIFKSNVAQAHGRTATFKPGFGCRVSDAVQASASAYPFFERKRVTTEQGDKIELVDGGYCANNPTLYAIADAIAALKFAPENIRVVNVGVGVYPTPRHLQSWLVNRIPGGGMLIELIQKMFETNTQSMGQLRDILFKDVPTIRISETFERPEMAADLFERNMQKLNLLRQRGRESFARYEADLRDFLLP